jgi:NAD(P)-dependent dehydrogenase (short-subunit alcohol dehydrogenase family)
MKIRNTPGKPSIHISMASKGVAFITGASQGIGRAISLRLADDGFDIAVNDLPSAQHNLDELSKEIMDKGRKTFIITGDVSVDAEVDHMVTSVVENLGSLDVVSTRLFTKFGMLMTTSR